MIIHKIITELSRKTWASCVLFVDAGGLELAPEDLSSGISAVVESICVETQYEFIRPHCYTKTILYRGLWGLNCAIYFGLLFISHFAPNVGRLYPKAVLTLLCQRAIWPKLLNYCPGTNDEKRKPIAPGLVKYIQVARPHTVWRNIIFSGTLHFRAHKSKGFRINTATQRRLCKTATWTTRAPQAAKRAIRLPGLRGKSKWAHMSACDRNRVNLTLPLWLNMCKLITCWVLIPWHNPDVCYTS